MFANTHVLKNNKHPLIQHFTTTVGVFLVEFFVLGECTLQQFLREVKKKQKQKKTIRWLTWSGKGCYGKALKEEVSFRNNYLSDHSTMTREGFQAYGRASIGYI